MSEEKASEEEGRISEALTGRPEALIDSPLPATPEERAGRLAVLRSEGQDAARRLGAAREAFRNHVFWMAFGASPGALIPLLFAISELGGQALIVLIVLMVLVESRRAFQSRMEVKRLEVVVGDFRERIAELREATMAADQPSQD